MITIVLAYGIAAKILISLGVIIGAATIMLFLLAFIAYHILKEQANDDTLRI